MAPAPLPKNGRVPSAPPVKTKIVVPARPSSVRAEFRDLQNIVNAPGTMPDAHCVERGDGTEDTVAPQPIRLKDLCPEDKRKVAKLIQQVVEAGQENEGLRQELDELSVQWAHEREEVSVQREREREAARVESKQMAAGMEKEREEAAKQLEEERAAGAARLDKLRKQNGEIIAEIASLRSKLSSAFVMIRSYQLKMKELQPQGTTATPADATLASSSDNRLTGTEERDVTIASGTTTTPTGASGHSDVREAFIAALGPTDTQAGAPSTDVNQAKARLFVAQTKNVTAAPALEGGGGGTTTLTATDNGNKGDRHHQHHQHHQQQRSEPVAHPLHDEGNLFAVTGESGHPQDGAVIEEYELLEVHGDDASWDEHIATLALESATEAPAPVTKATRGRAYAATEALAHATEGTRTRSTAPGMARGSTTTTIEALGPITKAATAESTSSIQPSHAINGAAHAQHVHSNPSQRSLVGASLDSQAWPRRDNRSLTVRTASSASITTAPPPLAANAPPVTADHPPSTATFAPRDSRSSAPLTTPPLLARTAPPVRMPPLPMASAPDAPTGTDAGPGQPSSVTAGGLSTPAGARMTAVTADGRRDRREAPPSAPGEISASEQATQGQGRGRDPSAGIPSSASSSMPASAPAYVSPQAAPAALGPVPAASGPVPASISPQVFRPGEPGIFTPGMPSPHGLPASISPQRAPASTSVMSGTRPSPSEFPHGNAGIRQPSPLPAPPSSLSSSPSVAHFNAAVLPQGVSSPQLPVGHRNAEAGPATATAPGSLPPIPLTEGHRTRDSPAKSTQRTEWSGHLRLGPHADGDHGNRHADGTADGSAVGNAIGSAINNADGTADGSSIGNADGGVIRSCHGLEGHWEGAAAAARAADRSAAVPAQSTRGKEATPMAERNNRGDSKGAAAMHPVLSGRAKGYSTAAGHPAEYRESDSSVLGWVGKDNPVGWAGKGHPPSAPSHWAGDLLTVDGDEVDDARIQHCPNPALMVGGGREYAGGGEVSDAPMAGRDMVGSSQGSVDVDELDDAPDVVARDNRSPGRAASHGESKRGGKSYSDHAEDEEDGHPRGQGDILEEDDETGPRGATSYLDVERGARAYSDELLFRAYSDGEEGGDRGSWQELSFARHLARVADGLEALEAFHRSGWGLHPIVPAPPNIPPPPIVPIINTPPSIPIIPTPAIVPGPSWPEARWLDASKPRGGDHRDGGVHYGGGALREGGTRREGGAYREEGGYREGGYREGGHQEAHRDLDHGDGDNSGEGRGAARETEGGARGGGDAGVSTRHGVHEGRISQRDGQQSLSQHDARRISVKALCDQEPPLHDPQAVQHEGLAARRSGCEPDERQIWQREQGQIVPHESELAHLESKQPRRSIGGLHQARKRSAPSRAWVPTPSLHAHATLVIESCYDASLLDIIREMEGGGHDDEVVRGGYDEDELRIVSGTIERDTSAPHFCGIVAPPLDPPAKSENEPPRNAASRRHWASQPASRQATGATNKASGEPGERKATGNASLPGERSRHSGGTNASGKPSTKIVPRALPRWFEDVQYEENDIYGLVEDVELAKY